MTKENYPELLPDTFSEDPVELKKALTETREALREIIRIRNSDIGDFDTVEGRTNIPFATSYETGVTGLSTETPTTSDIVSWLDASDGNNPKKSAFSAFVSMYATTGILVGFQVLTSSSGTYTPTSGATNGIAIAIGSGGGGGGADSAGGGAETAAGGGGGGGCAIARFTISGTVSYTIGSAGTAGSTSGGNGGDGGDATLTGIVVATGGKGATGTGSGAADQKATIGGLGGIGTTGTLLLGGQDGGNAFTTKDAMACGGFGGTAPFGGGGGRPGFMDNAGTETAASDGNQYGGGGGGGATQLAAGKAGGAGASGVIYIFEFK